MYGEGISKEGSLLDVGIVNEVVQKSGAWFAYDGERLGQGREKAKQFLKENPNLRDEIEGRIYEKLGLSRPGFGAPAADATPEDATAAAPEGADDPFEDFGGTGGGTGGTGRAGQTV